MTDIIFIGAGPIGLLGAIQLKLQFPEKEILMFEKYEVPVRNHAMYVEQSSFSGMDRSKGFGEVLDSIPSKVLISDLEKKLREYAASIGIKIQYQEVKDFNELKKQYPETDYFVGSGGLRGIIHPQVFNGENQINESLRYAVEVKYKASGTTRALNKVTELPGVLAYTNHLVSEYVGHLKEGQTPISLRIFIDEPTYQAMKGATFKAPYTLSEDKIPSNLYETITTYLKGRKHLAGELIEKDSLKISTITLSLYASKDFCKQVDGKIIFQIGEEGFACPFYRSFNDNASCIPFFTKAMKALFKNSNVESNKIGSSSIFSSSTVEETPLEYYQHNVQGLVNSEIRTIHYLNFGIDMLETSVASSQSVPKLTGAKLNLKRGGKTFLNEVEREPQNDESEKRSSSTCVLL
ncbi:hypothetical protein Lgra_0843 [Legionella gratiana]|uniref:Uncharacterized protein n=1 Tax=Legionella gratiana TaxID=45066 RepID=A0A378JG74_9GAMM|nr:hypothetical protein [Legionella gratiana]KTD13708.1 hypothetical protein Lgra_0843 [Legionella gratiana]STX45981.1 Uncharacterised protein [Legionella gratiana]